MGHGVVELDFISGNVVGGLLGKASMSGHLTIEVSIYDNDCSLVDRVHAEASVATVFHEACLRQSSLFRAMALRMVRSFLAQAVMATLKGFPASWRRWRKARMVGS